MIRDQERFISKLDGKQYFLQLIFVEQKEKDGKADQKTGSI